ncbi:hypothetical protein [Microbacterium sp. NPDC089696]|uniref:hypothetical protein n=1 Tax=Microbacterium sp. NPDC089696 TaxID=3364199 RepID=UPI0037F2D531
MALTKWERVEVTCDAGPLAIINALQEIPSGSQLVAMDTQELPFFEPAAGAIRRVTLTFERLVP